MSQTQINRPLNGLPVNHRAPAGPLGHLVGTHNWTCLELSVSCSPYKILLFLYSSFDSRDDPITEGSVLGLPLAFLQPHPSQRGKGSFGPGDMPTQHQYSSLPTLPPGTWNPEIPCPNAYPKPAATTYVGPFPGGPPGGRQHCQHVRP